MSHAPAPRARTNPVVWVLIVIGAVLIVIGIIYFTVKAGSLPSFMGKVHGKGSQGHRTTRGSVALVVGVVLVIAGVVLALVTRRRGR